MPRTKKPKKQNRKKPARSGERRIDRRRLLSILSTTATVLLATGLVVGLVIGRRHMLTRVEQERRAVPMRVAFDWPALPSDPDSTWMDVDSRRDLQAVAISWLEEDPYAPSSMRAAHAALMQTGWFAGDCTLAREPDGVLRISGRWRVPAAVVRAEGRDRLIAATGERLPVAYPPDTSGRKVILGVEDEPLPELGERWISNGGIRAALDLLRFIRDTPGYDQVHAVDVANFKARRELVLVTDRGTRILWGGPVGDFTPGQASDEEKRSRLTRVHARFGRIDAGAPYVDISLESRIEYQQPAAESTGM